MKVYSIIDESRKPFREIAFLLYYEKSRSFLIEIDDRLPAEELPIMMTSFLRRGIHTIDPDWSRRWVNARIVPADRQNLGMILRDNGLKEYDPMKLLRLGQGRCAQDDCAIREVKYEDLPLWVLQRQEEKLRLVRILENWTVLLGFGDGTLRRVDLQPMIEEDQSLWILKTDRQIFGRIQLLPGGSGICWSEWIYLPLQKLAGAGEKIPLSLAELRRILQEETVDTAAAAAMLECSRQYVARLVRNGMLKVAGEGMGTRLYYRSDVERLTW